MDYYKNLDKKLKIKKKKKKTYIVDGYILYLIECDENIKCICNDKDNELCKHIIYYFYTLDLDLYLLNHWKFIKKYILKQIELKYIDNYELWGIIDKEISNKECGICLDNIYSNKKYYICKYCNNLLHYNCYLKWIKNNNNCIYCRKELS
jgi:hypothetical protein